MPCCIQTICCFVFKTFQQKVCKPRFVKHCFKSFLKIQILDKLARNKTVKLILWAIVTFHRNSYFGRALKVIYSTYNLKNNFGFINILLDVQLSISVSHKSHIWTILVWGWCSTQILKSFDRQTDRQTERQINAVMREHEDNTGRWNKKLK